MLPKKGFGAWSILCMCSVSVCVSVRVHTLVSACARAKATCSHKQRNGIGSIQPAMIHCQRDYSLQWHFCKRVDSPSFRFCSVSTKRLHCLEQKELLFPSVSFIEEEFSSKLWSQNPLLAVLACKDSATRQLRLQHWDKSALDVLILGASPRRGLIKLTKTHPPPVSWAARTWTRVLFLQAAWAWWCRLLLGLQSAVQGVDVRIRSGPNNSLWQKQAKEDVETRRDLTGSRPAIHSFSALLILNTSLRIHRKCLSNNMARIEFHITMRKGWNGCGVSKANERTTAGRKSSPPFHLTSRIVFIAHLQMMLHLFLLCEQGNKKKKRLFGANYSQHVLYTPFNELDWRHGHWLWLARPVIQDEPCNLPHVTPVMCKSPYTSNSLLGLHWSRDEAPLKQHNSSRSVSAHRRGRGWGGVGGGAGAGSSLS